MSKLAGRVAKANKLPEGALLSTAEAAAILEVHPSAVRRAIARGDLNALRIGSVLLVWRASLDGYQPIRKGWTRREP